MKFFPFLVCVLTLAPLPLTAGGKQDAAGTRGDAAGALAEMERALADREEDFSPEDEYYLGRSVSAVILGRYRLYAGNSALSGYLNKICGAIVINSPRPGIFNGYHVMILDSPEINAFATTGGHIFITLGFVRTAGGEDMLAAVIAHEIAHIQLRHSMEMIKDSGLYRDMSDVVKRARGLASREERRQIFDRSVSEMVNTIFTNGYSQAQEFDADAYAMKLLAAAGYEPGSLIDVLEALNQNQPVFSPGINTTHPPPPLRIANARKNAGGYNIQDTRAFRLRRFNSTGKNP
ncbi:MAG: M48 family metallopeptidase [Treponema sp.]|jgi:predicted Zn-dependent protease|nr:M48 family metallopeptidase [Treponema sp.]